MKKTICTWFRIINTVIFIIIFMLMILTIGQAVIIPENVDVFTCGIVLISSLPILVINRIVDVIVKIIMNKKEKKYGAEMIKREDAPEKINE